MKNVWDIFICYRQIDGQEIAQWVYEHLHGKQLPAKVHGENITLKVYWDAATPALSNWVELHKPALENSRALIVICTPGLFAKLNDKDWVHMELEWWIENRKTAPIILDATGEGERWLPEQVKKKWPYAQRLSIALQEWKQLGEEKRDEIENRTVNRILEGIYASETQIRFEDLEKQKKLVRRFRMAFIAMLLMACGVAAGFFVVRDQNEQARQMLALSTMSQARDAILKNDQLTALALSVRAIDYGNSPDITEQFLAIQYWATGNFSGAKKHLEKVMEKEYERAIDINRSPLQADRLAQLASTRSAFNDWMLLTAELGEHAYDAVLLFKGLNSRIEEVTRNQLLKATKDYSSLALKVQATEADLSHLINGQSEHQPDYKKTIAELSRLYEERSHYFNTSHEAVEKQLVSSWSEIQQKLNPGEVIIDFLKYHDRYAVWILKKTDYPIRVELGRASELEPLINASYNPIIKNTANSVAHRGIMPLNLRSEKSHQIAQKVWAPISKHIQPGDSILYIVPDGVFSGFQFSTLPIALTNKSKQKGGGSDSILLDEKIIAYLSYAQELSATPVRNPGRGLCLAGGVDYDMELPDSDSTTKMDFTLHTLPFTREEVESIASIAKKYGKGPVFLFTGAKANESQFRKTAPGANILHLATHGWSSLAIARFPPDSLIKKRDEKKVTDGFLLSLDPTITAGLAFSGLNAGSRTGMNDGRMSAMEISGLQLDSVSLVVLSACNTVGEVFAGDGVFGLIRGFKRAGVKNIIATYSITFDAKETVDFFSIFYENMLGKSQMPPAIALRQAMLACKRKGMNRDLWAPYAAYGPIR